MNLGLLSVVAFSSPKAPAPDPELEAQRKEREDKAKSEAIDLSRRAGKSRTLGLTRGNQTMLSGYGGYDKESTLG